MTIQKANKIDDGNKSKENLIKVVKGSIISILFSIVFLLILSVILTFTNMPEASIPTAIIVTSVISILTGSIFSSMNIKKNGLINGALVGLIYILALYLLSSILFTGFSISVKSIIMIICSTLAGMIGGIIGVNIYKK